ncbi:ArsR/SmtB family transcription factor [Agromyces sp. ZXT2-6]|uniref:ArsR/SmtB family transcription factor n=1 Tax=Agromyces sp. ZXT2-6 TaxID=3461153 RepID=UPI004055186D
MTEPTHPFTLLADPVRRRIVEVLAVGEHSAGTLCDVVMTEFGISRTAVSHHLRVLRDHDAVTSLIDAVEPRARSYRLNRAFLAVLDEEVERLLRLSDHRYGTVERLAPPPVDPPRSRGVRRHRFGEAEARRRAESRAAWAGSRIPTAGA